MKSTAGFTLIEVLVAIVVLAMGVLAAAAMQTSALRASNDARAVQEVTKLAEREIALWRQIELRTFYATESSPAFETKCETKSTQEAKIDVCQVIVRPCRLDTTAGTPPTVAMNCPTSSSVAPADRVADQITVTVTGLRNKTLTLRTVKAR